MEKNRVNGQIKAYLRFLGFVQADGDSFHLGEDSARVFVHRLLHGFFECVDREERRLAGGREPSGDGVRNLAMDFRSGIDVMTTETSCLSSIWETDETVQAALTAHGIVVNYNPMN